MDKDSVLENVYLVAKVGTIHHKILPFFLEHYIKKIGILPQNCLITVHDNHSELLDNTLKCLQEYRIKPFTVWQGEFTQLGMTYHFLKMLTSVDTDKWVVPADSDEFNFLDTPLAALIKECEREGYDYVSSVMIDMVAQKGIPELDTSVPLHEQFPYESQLTKYIGLGMGVKMVLMRPYVIPDCGGFHTPSQRFISHCKRHPITQKTYHFKWHGNIYNIMKAYKKPVNTRLCRYIETHDSLIVTSAPPSYYFQIYLKQFLRRLKRVLVWN